VSLCHSHPRNSALSLFNKIHGVSFLWKLVVVLLVYKFHIKRPYPRLYKYLNSILLLSSHFSPTSHERSLCFRFSAKFLYANTSTLTRAMKVSTTIYPMTGFCESKCSKIHTLLKNVITFLSVRFWSKSSQDSCT